jgi:hypothetical protein
LIATQGCLFSHIGDTHCYCSSLSSPPDTTRSLSTEGHSRSDNNTRLSLLRRSLARSVCLDVPTGLSRSPPPAERTLRITLNFSPQKASAAAGRPAACTMAKGAGQRTSTAPSSTLSSRPQRRLRSSSSAALASYRKSSSR